MKPLKLVLTALLSAGYTSLWWARFAIDELNEHTKQGLEAAIIISTILIIVFVAFVTWVFEVEL